jgi:hypothetical protein
MVDFVVRACGAFFLPQLALSVVTVALSAAYLLAWLRGELRRDQPSWHRALDPLAGVSIGVGLLGAVVSFCMALGSMTQSGGFEMSRIFGSLAMAYVSTAVGLVTALIASLVSWFLGVMVRR